MKVLMLLFSAFENDSRVDRCAKTLVQEGHEVLLLAKHKLGLPAREHLNGYLVERKQWEGDHFDPVDVAKESRFKKGWTLFSGKPQSTPQLHQGNIPAALENYDSEEHAVASATKHFNSRKRQYDRFTLLALKAAEEFVPDIIHAHDYNTLLAAGEINARYGTPFIYDTHELWVHRNRRKVAFLKEEVDWEYSEEKRLMRRAAGSITVCDSIADYLMHEYKIPRPVVIRNTPERDTNRRVKEKSLRRALGIGQDDFLAVYVGRITYNRGVSDILRALPHLPEQVKFVALGLFGNFFEVEFWKEIRDLNLEGRAFQFGPVPSLEVADWIKEADVSLTTMTRACLSYTFTLPNKLFESLQAEVPIIGPDSPEIVRVTNQYRCGLTYRDGDSVHLATQIDGLRQAPERLRELKEGTKKAAEDLCWDNERHRLVDIYKKLPLAKVA